MTKPATFAEAREALAESFRELGRELRGIIAEAFPPKPSASSAPVTASPVEVVKADRFVARLDGVGAPAVHDRLLNLEAPFFLPESAEKATRELNSGDVSPFTFAWRLA